MLFLPVQRVTRHPLRTGERGGDPHSSLLAALDTTTARGAECLRTGGVDVWITLSKFYSLSVL